MMETHILESDLFQVVDEPECVLRQMELLILGSFLSIIKRTKEVNLTYHHLQQSRHGWWPLDTTFGHLMQPDINNEAVMMLWAAGVNNPSRTELQLLSSLE